MKKMDDNAVLHIGVVVPDAKKAAEYPARVFGIPLKSEGPFGKLSGYGQCNTRYMGKPTDGCGYNYVFSMGSVEIEYIQPVDGPSTWQDYLNEHPKGGVHHIAWLVKDTDETAKFLEGEKAPKIAEGQWDTGRYAYFDTADVLGFLLETHEHFGK